MDDKRINGRVIDVGTDRQRRSPPEPSTYAHRLSTVFVWYSSNQLSRSVTSVSPQFVSPPGESDQQVGMER